MSRSGTLQDALRSVDAFQRAENPAPNTKLSGRVSVGDTRQSDSDDLNESGRNYEKKKKKKKKKDQRAIDERKAGKERKTSRRVRDYSDEERKVSEEDVKEKKRSDGKRYRNREHRKKDKDSRRKERRGDREKFRSRRSSHKPGGRKARRSEKNFPSFSESSDASTSQSSDSENERDAPIPQQIAKEIMDEFPDVASDLKQLLQMVDAGQGVDISGLPNRRLISLLQKLFQCLRLDKSKNGIYLLPSGDKPSLQRVGLSMEIPVVSAPDADSVHGGPDPSSSREKRTRALIEDQEKAEMPQKDNGKRGPTGPTKRRVIGPPMPSKDMLEAAARLTEAEAALRAAEEELEGDPMVGPPPPAAVAEAACANDAERFEEVTRILGPDVSNAYEILGVKREVPPADLKKRYWKLSLLVHPDKCEHPQAHEAFMVLNNAFKDLQDPSKRSIINQKLDDKQAREEYEADLKARREAAQWRKLRGEEAEPGDAELLTGEMKEPKRDEWMTVLPPERQAGKPTQQSTYFSRSEKSGRGDTSVWTDTPLEKAQKAKMQYLEAYKQATITDREPDEGAFEREKTAKAAAMIDDFNKNKRALSLVEKHQQENIQELKKRTKKGEGEQAPLLSREKEMKDKEWQQNHPWKPWDREKDLVAGRQALKWDSQTGREGLDSRFGTGTGERKFL
ncbi:hypothetical protein R1sor_016945 [Riccia sorocarpa]|uniref:J domain-containing protein n=1 Tax=Riccia sorocarpa TaxID=122646 RepID=A0ABD3I5F6_9MARC